MIDFAALGEALRIDKSLFFNFSLAFSRLEYAAKDLGIVLPPNGENRRRLEVDWTSFAHRIAPALEAAIANDENIASAVSYFDDHPPKKQMLVNGTAEFVQSRHQHPSQAERIFVYLRRVRNNLFHGGKGFMFEHLDRDEMLLHTGLLLISAIVDRDPQLRSSFYGGIIVPPIAAQQA